MTWRTRVVAAVVYVQHVLVCVCGCMELCVCYIFLFLFLLCQLGHRKKEKKRKGFRRDEVLRPSPLLCLFFLSFVLVLIFHYPCLPS
ncbi:hypothetical protein TRSC58_07677 [Trypanosoma rangeli SC58]|uniref:Uncharacterized protein n=1 Tax=Trypanosoma rangeli SC58 TaxID=429131 RepID=A0A061IRP6_TRYRA|nr:hypothetical protein TRSC58_07677 [Trypanosoma rangeli SC58]